MAPPSQAPRLGGAFPPGLQEGSFQKGSPGSQSSERRAQAKDRSKESVVTLSRENKIEIGVTLGHVKDLCFDLTGSKETIKGIKSRCDIILCAL